MRKRRWKGKQKFTTLRRLSERAVLYSSIFIESLFHHLYYAFEASVPAGCFGYYNGEYIRTY